MNHINLLEKAAQYQDLKPEKFQFQCDINLITNFTDASFKQFLTGACLNEGIYPRIIAAGYKQYAFELANSRSAIYTHQPDISFIFFDVTAYARSAFWGDDDHFSHVLSQLEHYARAVQTPVVVNEIILPYRGPYGNLFFKNPLAGLISRYNAALLDLSRRVENVRIFDTNRIVHWMGEQSVRDMRGLYAFDMPFTSAFTVQICKEWIALIRALFGMVKKCIVLDLDNILWGGVVGEVGPAGIQLGPDYPGNAYVNFQHALKGYYDRGILLAINSKNNEKDIEEVFQQNPSMVLKPEYFSAVRMNWNDKAQNMLEIAQELNIGLASMVFLDDDPMNRYIVSQQLPEVLVPDFSLPPEAYSNALFSLDVFHQQALTDEDRKKGKMYAQERERKLVLHSAATAEEYIAKLGLNIIIHHNEPGLSARISQMSQKTNQFNLTTKRYSETDITRMLTQGVDIFSANVSDTFGDYGETVAAIVRREGENADLDSFLMSCRVLGRGVEFVFFDYILRWLAGGGTRQLGTRYIPTAKNAPAKDFLSSAGAANCRIADDGTVDCVFNLPQYVHQDHAHVNPSILIHA